MQYDQRVQGTTSETFGRYQRLKRVGRGGMGEVWLCQDALLHRQVAIKTLPPHSQQDQEYVVRFEREAQAAAALNHPHILPVHDYGSQSLPQGELTTYLVMPYVAGGSLADMIEQLTVQQQGMEQDLALLFLSQAADAIDYAHEQGMVHRDIKPANMLLRSDDWLLLADFGVVRIVSSSDEFTDAGMIIGTPLYMAPEQAQGKAEAASDTYSLAVLAYQLCVGRPPFKAETSYATIIQHMLLPPPPPRQFHPDLPAACEEVLLRGLAKQPADRYASARLFVDELKRSLGITVSVPTLLTAPTEANKHTTRRKVLLGTGAGLLALGAGAGFWTFTTIQKTSTKSAASPEVPAMVLREHLGPVSILAWHPTKNTLTSACDDFNDTTVKLWDIDSFRYRQQPEYESTKSVELKGTNIHLAWSPDGTYLAAANGHSDLDYNHSAIDIYQADLNALVKGFEKGIIVPVLSVGGLGWLQNRFPTALWLSTLDSGTTFHLGMWDVTQPALTPAFASVQGQTSTVSVNIKEQSLCIAPNGRQVAIGTLKGVLTGTIAIGNNRVIWQPDQHPPLVLKQSGYGGSAHFLSWSMGSRRLLSVIDPGVFDSIAGWDTTTYNPLRFGIPPDALNFTTLACHPSATNSMFAGGTEDGKIYLWSGEARKQPIRTLVAPDINASVLALSWSHDGQWLAASYKDIDATILIWKI